MNLNHTNPVRVLFCLTGIAISQRHLRLCMTRNRIYSVWNEKHSFADSTSISCPLSMLLYLLSYLDRITIGSARLYHLEEDLHLQGDQFQTAVSIFAVTYIRK